MADLALVDTPPANAPAAAQLAAQIESIAVEIEQLQSDAVMANRARAGERIKQLHDAEPKLFQSMLLEALMDSATRGWQAPPRKIGPDLFSILDTEVPEHLTRRPPNGSDDDDDLQKVDCHFATVSDFNEDGVIKMRKAAQSSAAAEKQMRAVDEAKRRAKGKLNVFLRDISDQQLSKNNEDAE
jgi:hypothetical protein